MEFKDEMLIWGIIFVCFGSHWVYRPSPFFPLGIYLSVGLVHHHLYEMPMLWSQGMLSLLLSLVFASAGFLLVLSVAFESTKDTALIQDVLKISEQDQNLTALIIEAVSNEKNEILSEILFEGYPDCDPNCYTDGYTPLMICCMKKQNKMAKLLLKHKNIDVEKESKGECFNGATPLMISLFHADYVSAKLLLDHGANPFCEHKGDTPLKLILRGGTELQLAETIVQVMHERNPEKTINALADSLRAAKERSETDQFIALMERKIEELFILSNPKIK